MVGQEGFEPSNQRLNLPL